MNEILATTTWRERLEELARRREVLLVAALVALVGAGAIVLRARSAEPTIAPPAEAEAYVGAPAGAPVPSTTVAPAAPGVSILVHVAGAVRRPGLYEMPAGARIADAIDAAKGPARAADLAALNLAEPLTDGQKIEVPRRGEAVEPAVPAAPVPTTASSAVPGGVVNINTADQVALEAIPGIGPVTAQAIIAYRTEIGSFTSIEQLLEVSGIGPATLESMRPYVTL